MKKNLVILFIFFCAFSVLIVIFNNPSVNNRDDVPSFPNTGGITFYFNGAVDTTWDNLENWWQEPTFETQADSLPADDDIVYIGAQMDNGPSVPVSLAHIYVADTIVGTGGNFSVVLDGASGDATFGDSSFNNGTVNGNAIFHASSYNAEGGIINGDATFDAMSYNQGDINGSATFTDSSSNQSGGITGNAIMSGTSRFDSNGSVGGNLTFTESSRNDNSTTVTGSVTFNDSSINSDTGTINGDAMFNEDFSENVGIVLGTKTRLYTSSISTTRDFVADGPWTVVSDGEGTVVDVTGATYDGTTTFTPQNGGSFLPSDAGAPSGTLYFYNPAGRNWDDVANWWTDEAFSIQASALPADGNTVYICSQIDSGPSTPVALALINVGGDVPCGVNDNIAVVLDGATGDATFNNVSYNWGTLTGAVTFNGFSGNYLSGVITGDVVFNSTGTNQGVISGSVTFNSSSANGGTINGPVTFYDSSRNIGGDGIINGDVIFHDTSYNQGTITGEVEFNDESNNLVGTIDGNAIFQGSSYNSGGSISGDVTFNDASYFVYGGIGGATKFNTTYYDTSVPAGGVFTFSVNGWSGSLPGTVNGSDDQPITEYIFNAGNNEGTLAGDAIFNADSINQGTVTGDAMFYDLSYNQGTITGDATFNDDSGDQGGETLGNATFNDASYNNGGTITGDATFNTVFYNTSAPSGGVFTFTNTAAWLGIVSGTVYGSDAQPIITYVFNDESLNNGTIHGDAIFNDSSSLIGTVVGDATFNTIYYNSIVPSGGVLTFTNDSWNGIVSGTIYGGDALPITSFVFYGMNHNFTPINSNVIFNGDQSENVGAVSGTKTRWYSSSIAPTRDFVGSGPWTVVSDGAGTVVDLTDATYDETTIFYFTNGGSFLPGSIVATEYIPPASPTPPAVSITAPVNGSTVSGSAIALSANATDDVSVSGVQFKLDTNTNIGAEDTASPYQVTWNSTGVADGSHTISAVARDGEGNYTTSAIITITVSNTPIVVNPGPTGGGGGLGSNSGNTGGSVNSNNNNSNGSNNGIGGENDTPPSPTIPAVIPGCNKTTGFSIVTGKSCLLNTGGDTTVTNYNFGTSTLTMQSKGGPVMELQKFLNRFLNLDLKVDGKLGPKTIAAVKKWQKANGLVADGFVGPKTKAKMYASVPGFPNTGKVVKIPEASPAPITSADQKFPAIMILSGALLIIILSFILYRKGKFND